MTDQQLLAISITVLAVLAGSVFNNVRITDLNSNFNRRFDDLRDLLRAENNAHFERLEAKIDRIGETLTAMLSNHEARIAALEKNQTQR